MKNKKQDLLIAILLAMIVGAVGIFAPVTASAQSGLQVITGPEKKAEQPKKKSRNNLSLSLQTELNRMGCKAGRADGQWGGQSERALKRAIAKEPALGGQKRSNEMLKQMRALPAGLCSLSCGANQVIENGKCVAAACKGGQVVSENGVCVDAVLATVGATLKATGLYDPNKYDGTWMITTKLAKKCKTPVSSFTVKIAGRTIKGSTESGVARSGKITLSGNADFRGANEAGDGNSVRFAGEFKKNSGKGTLKIGNGRSCKGTFVASRK